MKDVEMDDGSEEKAGFGEVEKPPPKKPPAQPHSAAAAKNQGEILFSETVCFSVRMAPNTILSGLPRGFRAQCVEKKRLLPMSVSVREMLLAFVLRHLGLPLEPKAQCAHQPPFRVNGISVPRSSDLTCGNAFLTLSLSSAVHVGALLEAIDLHKTQSVHRVEVSQVEPDAPRKVAVRIVGLSVATTQADADRFLYQYKLDSAACWARVNEAVGKRGTAKVVLRADLLPLLHAFPGKQAGTRFFKLVRSKASWQRCTRCWAHKPEGGGNCAECAIRCSRCLGEHLLRDCDQARGSCQHCHDAGLPKDECDTHIISMCRTLRDEEVPIAPLPAPTDALLRAYPALGQLAPRARVSVSSVAAKKDAGSSYIVLGRSWANVAGAGGIDAAQPDPELARLVAENKQLMQRISKMETTITELASQLSSVLDELQVLRFKNPDLVSTRPETRKPAPPPVLPASIAMSSASSSAQKKPVVPETPMGSSALSENDFPSLSLASFSASGLTSATADKLGVDSHMRAEEERVNLQLRKMAFPASSSRAISVFSAASAASATSAASAVFRPAAAPAASAVPARDTASRPKSKSNGHKRGQSQVATTPVGTAFDDTPRKSGKKACLKFGNQLYALPSPVKFSLGNASDKGMSDGEDDDQ